MLQYIYGAMPSGEKLYTISYCSCTCFQYFVCLSWFTFASDIHTIRLLSSSKFQLYTQKPPLEICRYTLHTFGIFSFNLLKAQLRFSIFMLSITFDKTHTITILMIYNDSSKIQPCAQVCFYRAVIAMWLLEF